MSHYAKPMLALHETTLQNKRQKGPDPLNFPRDDDQARSSILPVPLWASNDLRAEDVKDFLNLHVAVKICLYSHL